MKKSIATTIILLLSAALITSVDAQPPMADPRDETTGSIDEAIAAVQQAIATLESDEPIETQELMAIAAIEYAMAELDLALESLEYPSGVAPLGPRASR